MEIRNEEKFICGVESLINPMDVSSLLVFQKLKRIVPPVLMKRLLLRASRKTPYIGFVIEPYSLFFFFKLRDIDRARSLLPDRYELAEARLFADDEPGHYMGIGNLSTRASTFWGVRQECYLIARDKATGLLCWMFIDILSNTLIALPSKGIAEPNSARAVFTTNSRGDVFLDFSEDGTGRRLAATGNIRGGTRRRLDESLWVMGNTSIGHSKDLAAGDDEPFAVIFDPAEVDEGLDIPLEDVRIVENTLFPGLADKEPCAVICFPFAQHYIADSPGCHTSVKDRYDLIGKYNTLADSDRHRTFSARTIVRQLALAAAASVLIVVSLVLIF